jgi:hypothetical protein
MNQGLFDTAMHNPVVVRGDSASSAGILNWNSNNIILNREAVGVAGASFWSGIGYFPKSIIAEGTQIKYKYFIANSAFSGWESNISERVFTFPRNDTTLAWQFFNNKITPTAVAEPSRLVPNESQLFQNYPNPFNPTTSIRYTLARSSTVKLSIHNILGQTIAILIDERQDAGEHAVTWNAQSKSITSGVYFVRLSSGGVNLIQKIMLVK